MTHTPPIGAKGFDDHHPPDPSLIADCIHCGFCLPTCPTYELWGEEMDSPRGRIQLMELANNGEVLLDETVTGHFDACLGCMACVTACPSNVQYDKLIEATRGQVARNVERAWHDTAFRRALFWLFPNRARLRVAALGAVAYRRLGVQALLHRLGVIERLPARMQAMESLVPDVGVTDLNRRLPDRVAARSEPRAQVAMLTGCIQSVFFAGVNAATARVLAAEGCDVIIPESQGCCGALEVHSGEESSAVSRAKAMIVQMEAAEVDAVVVNAAGCGSSMKEYGHLLRDEPGWAERAVAFSAKVRDVSEYLVELGPRAERHPIHVSIAYQDACHLSHAQQVRSQPRDLLTGIPGLELREIAEPELCCGSAGVYNLLEPETAAELGERKAAHVADVTPDALVSANPGCTMQLRRFLDVPVAHPIQLLDASIRGLTPRFARPSA